MLALPVPSPEPYWALIANPVYRLAHSRRDRFLSGEIVSRADVRSALGRDLAPEVARRWDEWIEAAGYEPESEMTSFEDGFVRAPHQQLGFSFATVWAVPPDPQGMAARLMAICRENPQYLQDWEDAEAEPPSLCTTYLDFMVPIYESDDSTADIGFYTAVLEAFEDELTTWRAGGLGA